MYNREPWCKNCGKLLKPQYTGRPGEYCDTGCRQAAHRKRQQQQPDTTALDKELLAGAKLLVTETNDLLTLLQNNIGGEEPLAALVRIQHLYEKLLPKAAKRAKQRNVPWERIGQILHLHKDTARHKFGQHSSTKSGDSHATPGSTEAAPDDTNHTAGVAVQHSANRLAPVLSHLQRASKLSLRTVSERAGISASHLARILSGERFPNWSLTARIARVCGADTSALRTVWEDASAHSDRHAATTLVPALRHLQQRAGSPSAATIALTTDGHLNQVDVAAILDGAVLPDWSQIHRLVLALDGEPTYFRPLWLKATSDQTRNPTPRPTTRLTAARRPDSLETLVSAFNHAFASGGHHASTRPPRKRSLAPIPPLTCWSPPLDGGRR